MFAIVAMFFSIPSLVPFHATFSAEGYCRMSNDPVCSTLGQQFRGELFLYQNNNILLHKVRSAQV